MNAYLSDIRKELAKYIDVAFQKGASKFFREEVRILGVRSVNVQKIEKGIYIKSRGFSKKDLYGLCEQLLSSGYLEEGSIGLGLIQRNIKKYTKKDFTIFERWLKMYVSNWALCDDISTHILGYFIFHYPDLFEKNLKWAQSKNRWVRRASAVSLIYPLKHNTMLQQAFQVADMLLQDSDDMVQKGYGWILKVASEYFQKEVFAFVMARKNEMPRIALRYAIEKLPENMRRHAMT